MSDTPEQRIELRAMIASAINQCSAENGSNTPDFILANYMIDCLRAFDLATQQREHWYGLKMRPGQEPEKV